MQAVLICLEHYVTHANDQTDVCSTSGESGSEEDEDEI